MYTSYCSLDEAPLTFQLIITREYPPPLIPS